MCVWRAISTANGWVDEWLSGVGWRLGCLVVRKRTFPLVLLQVHVGLHWRNLGIESLLAGQVRMQSYGGAGGVVGGRGAGGRKGRG